MRCKYLSKEQILNLHSMLIERFGGSNGVRSQPLLDSAVCRCQQTFDGQNLYPDIFSKAAALLESLCKNHPFVDGNKRVAFLAATVFLDVDGVKTEFNVDEAEEFVLSVASGEKNMKEIEEWFKKAV